MQENVRCRFVAIWACFFCELEAARVGDRWHMSLRLCVVLSYSSTYIELLSTRPAGPMVRRLTTNQEIAGSTPASVIFLFYLFFVLFFSFNVIVYLKGYRFIQVIKRMLCL
ncbi:uncharacterized protein EURHEDRAFT_336934 [Aspergillus ruber CBS 135680]|uniref:Uncharacterized protein n=1 Tax=Aspergillus ruber (strain CBS 135680) TaxID=1388766 RepID=A0A017SK89_ASPRC|nr:uncharacterized protein EURHEDRAFT_336934 [Aspergillus ruber CBS 135680]EYE96735.1 hypothetical protein EURHEDRAFT_336934 [Aspergillus ruber CBS 135680]